MKIKKALKYILPFLLLTVPFLALAQGAVQGGLNSIRGPFGGAGGLAQASSNLTLTQLIVKVINIMLLLAGVIAVLFMVIGGYFYMTAAGNQEQVEKGKNTAVNAIIGLIIIILSFVIINVIVNLVSGPSIFGIFGF